MLVRGGSTVNLAIFDIDGTLTRTVSVDSACYARAFQDVHNLSDINSDWSTYRHSTDSGIAAELLERHLGRSATEMDLLGVRERFVELLKEAHSTCPDDFGAVRGAVETLRCVQARVGWTVAIATGGWKPSALLKLAAARFDVTGIPAAFADDAHARWDIIQTAIDRASTHYRVERFDRIVYIGDGMWDVRAAARLNIAFIGIGERERAERLARNGAELILPNFEPIAAFIDALQRARTPRIMTDAR